MTEQSPKFTIYHYPFHIAAIKLIYYPITAITSPVTTNYIATTSPQFTTLELQEEEVATLNWKHNHDHKTQYSAVHTPTHAITYTHIITHTASNRVHKQGRGSISIQNNKIDTSHHKGLPQTHQHRLIHL